MEASTRRFANISADNPEMQALHTTMGGVFIPRRRAIRLALSAGELRSALPFVVLMTNRTLSPSNVFASPAALQSFTIPLSHNAFWAERNTTVSNLDNPSMERVLFWASLKSEAQKSSPTPSMMQDRRQGMNGRPLRRGNSLPTSCQVAKQCCPTVYMPLSVVLFLSLFPVSFPI